MDKLMKSQFEEVTGFFQTVHSDFENFVIKHRKEINELTMKTKK